MELVRVFVAVELPPQVNMGLARIQSTLKGGGHTFVRWVPPEGIHLTLKFLGDVPTDTIPEITRALEEAARDIGPFPLETSGLGAFPNLRRPRVAWVEVKGDVDSLVLLQLQVDSSLTRLGFAKETRSFTAHLTLARVRDNASPEERQNFGKEITRHGPATHQTFMVHGLSLMRSTLTPGGAIYNRLSLIPLKG